jgi:hypothetical protein
MRFKRAPKRIPCCYSRGCHRLAIGGAYLCAHHRARIDELAAEIRASKD